MKFKLGNQEKFSLHQFLFTNTWFRIWFALWYKNITVIGRKNMYQKYPIILAPNHQNTAMDPLAIVYSQTRQIVWLARSDIFNNSIARVILRFFKVMPIYRMQDGLESLGNNEAVFNKSIEVLKANKILAIFPEGTHWGFRRLRATKKAIPRIAFMAEEKNNFELNTHIVPIGIYYDNYTNIRRNLLINIGTPFSISEYFQLYKDNPRQAQIELKNRIELEMKKVMLHINHTDEMYEAYDELRNICEQTTIKFFDLKGEKIATSFNASKKIIDTLDKVLETSPEKIETLKIEVLNYKKELQKLNYRDWLVASTGGDAFQIIWNILKLIIGIPIFIIGFIFHFLKFFYIQKITKKIVKDKQFFNSVNFSLSYLLVPISYGIYGCIYLYFTPYKWWSVFILFAFLLFTWILSFEYYIVFKKTYHMIRFNINYAKESPSIQALIKQRRKIIKTFSTFLHK